MAGALRGDWDVCHTGALPIMQGVLRGEDPVLLITPTERHEAVFVMARREFTTLERVAIKADCIRNDGCSFCILRG